jgi:hypothetical protein
MRTFLYGIWQMPFPMFLILRSGAQRRVSKDAGWRCSESPRAK